MDRLFQPHLQSRVLAALLPKLLSGDLRVPAAARLVEAGA